MDLVKILNELTENGYCPALIFDDNGHWALAFDGTQPVNFYSEPQSMHTTFYIEAGAWKNSVEEAVEYGLQTISTDEGDNSEKGY